MSLGSEPARQVVFNFPGIGLRDTELVVVPRVGETVRFRGTPYRVTDVTYDTIEVDRDIRHNSIFVTLKKPPEGEVFL